jgi:uncharacterized protein
VHPEAYPLVRRITERTGVGVAELIGNTRVLSELRPEDFADDTFGVPTVTDVLAELDKPGRDPRPEFRTAALAEGIEKISDLTPGMVLEGTVTNVAAFGAFVDVGVHQDGLVHVSAMAERRVNDPHEIVRTGQVVKVKVMEIDVERQRIGLSLRLTDEPGKPAQRSRGGRGGNGGNGGGRRDGQRGQGRQNQGGRQGGRGAAPAASGSMADALRRAGKI